MSVQQKDRPDIAEDLSDSTATVVIESASVDTRSDDRDKHQHSVDFFDVETYPEIRFDSSSIDEVDEICFIATGELTIRDMTKTVPVPLELSLIKNAPTYFADTTGESSAEDATAEEETARPRLWPPQMKQAPTPQVEPGDQPAEQSTNKAAEQTSSKSPGKPFGLRRTHSTETTPITSSSPHLG